MESYKVVGKDVVAVKTEEYKVDVKFLEAELEELKRQELDIKLKISAIEYKIGEIKKLQEAIK